MDTVAHTRDLTGSSDREPDSRARVWTSRVLVAFSVIFLVFDSVTKLMEIKPVTDSMTRLGWEHVSAQSVGAVLLVCVAFYVVPRTAVFGAVLLTGYLGGAVATNVRVGNPFFSHVLFPVYIGVLVWGGLYLREARLRALFPLRDTDR